MRLLTVPLLQQQGRICKGRLQISEAQARRHKAAIEQRRSLRAQSRDCALLASFWWRRVGMAEHCVCELGSLCCAGLCVRVSQKGLLFSVGEAPKASLSSLPGTLYHPAKNLAVIEGADLSSLNVMGFAMHFSPCLGRVVILEAGGESENGLCYRQRMKVASISIPALQLGEASSSSPSDNPQRAWVLIAPILWLRRLRKPQSVQLC